ncbi:MAG TPA: protein kinase, partial [Actinoplanes sp.]|nr:protein kinase [Actinoplanes sp.]
DVKPANILYSHFNSAVLADFGLAVLGEMRDSWLTLEVLTPAYAPPETFSHDVPSAAVDVYSLCATLYAVMHGRPPRWDTDRSPSLIGLMELFRRPIPDLPGIPLALTDVLRHGMANEPKDRPTAEDLRGMLSSLRLGPDDRRPPPVFPSTAFVTPRPAPADTPTQPDNTPTIKSDNPRRGRRLWPF